MSTVRDLIRFGLLLVISGIVNTNSKLVMYNRERSALEKTEKQASVETVFCLIRNLHNGDHLSHCKFQRYYVQIDL